MEFRGTQKRDLFENPAYLEAVFEEWRKEIFDAERKTQVRRKRGTFGVSAAVRRYLGAIRRALTFERSDGKIEREIRSQGPVTPHRTPKRSARSTACPLTHDS